MVRTNLVSIIAVCYNHEQYVVQTLDSILEQTYSSTELIIVDDCSSDNSAHRIREWIQKNAPEARFIAHQENRGVCSAINDGLKFASGEYVQLIACDDELMPNKLFTQVKQLQKRSEVALACSDCFVIDEFGDIIRPSFYPSDFIFPDDPFSAIITGHQGSKIIIHAPTVLIRRKALDHVGEYPEDLIQEDLYMWLSLTHENQVIYEPTPLVRYRNLQGSLSDTSQDKLKRERFLKDTLKVLDLMLAKNMSTERRETIERAVIKHLSSLARIQIEISWDNKELEGEISDILIKISSLASESPYLRTAEVKAYERIAISLWRFKKPCLSLFYKLRIGHGIRFLPPIKCYTPRLWN